jgi:hypothetical protein
VELSVFSSISSLASIVWLEAVTLCSIGQFPTVEAMAEAVLGWIKGDHSRERRGLLSNELSDDGLVIWRKRFLHQVPRRKLQLKDVEKENNNLSGTIRNIPGKVAKRTLVPPMRRAMLWSVKVRSLVPAASR